MTSISGDFTENNQRLWEPVRNVSDETIPPFSIVEITNAGTGTAENGRDYYSVTKPTVYGAMPWHLITWAQEIPEGGYGMASNSFPAWVSYSEGGGTFTVGAHFGSIADSFQVHHKGVGFLCVGNDPAKRLVRVIRNPSLIIAGKMNEDIATGETKSMSVWWGTVGNLSDSGEDVNVYDPFAALSEDDEVRAIFMHDGWELIAGDPC